MTAHKKDRAYWHARRGVSIPAEAGKQIFEFIGRVAGGEERFSVAYMEAPPGWKEPAQNPAFHEITLLQQGRLQAEVNGEPVEIGPGEVLVVYAGNRVQYSNPYSETAFYWAICLPAFSPELARRTPF